VVLRAGEARPADVDAAVAPVDCQRLLVLLLAESDGPALDDDSLPIGHRAGAAEVVLRDRERVRHRVARLPQRRALERDEREVEVAGGVETEPGV
jgi:hypothetical protein